MCIPTVIRTLANSLKQKTEEEDFENLPGMPTSLHPHFSITYLPLQMNMQEDTVYFG